MTDDTGRTGKFGMANHDCLQVLVTRTIPLAYPLFSTLRDLSRPKQKEVGRQQIISKHLGSRSAHLCPFTRRWMHSSQTCIERYRVMCEEPPYHRMPLPLPFAIPFFCDSIWTVRWSTGPD